VIIRQPERGSILKDGQGPTRDKHAKAEHAKAVAAVLEFGDTVPERVRILVGKRKRLDRFVTSGLDCFLQPDPRFVPAAGSRVVQGKVLGNQWFFRKQRGCRK